MKRIAIIRGSNLNKFEMQSFEPLTTRYDVHAFSSRRTNFETDGINFPVHRILCSDDLIELLLPRRTRRFVELALTEGAGVTQALFTLRERLRGFDIVHTADPHYYYSYQAAKAKLLFGFKLVTTQWENIPFMRERTRRRRRMKYLVLSVTDHFIAVTQRAKEALMLEGVGPERISILPPGIDIERFKPRSKAPSFLNAVRATERDIIVSFVGRMTQAKGLEFLLWSFKRLQSDPAIRGLGRAVRLVLFGKGSKEGQYKRLVDRLGLSQDVCFYGSCPYSEMEMVYNGTDIFVLPSIPLVFPFPWQEQLGMVLLESMASECAVLTTQSGSIPEVVGDAALVCQPADFLDLSNKLRVLCLDADLRKELGRKARERVLRLYNSTVNADRLAEIYERLGV